MAWALVLLAAWCQATAAIGEQPPDASRLTVDRIYLDREFRSEKLTARWLANGRGYTTLETPRDAEKGQAIVLHDPSTGDSEVLISAARLVPAGQSQPLEMDDHAWSDDMSRLLIHANSRRVWRRNTRGDYWVLDRASRQLRQLGAGGKPRSLMFAKFSPTGRQVAYVRDGDIYVEDLRDHRITRLTTSDSPEVIHGTFDWVYEEELQLRDGFRWSPDGKSIAFWQLDCRGVREFALINNTDSLYPEVTKIRYPKVGQTNPAARLGVVGVDGGPVTWLQLPGDARDHYIARMEWAGRPDQLVVQQLNRLQNTNRVSLVDSRTGKAETILEERDEAWVDIHDEMQWTEDGQQFTWISERDQWRHLYLVSRAGDEIRRITRGPFDVEQLLRIDERTGWAYFIASPDDPTQRYLYRVRLDGTGLARVTPAGETGTHQYEISPDGQWAIHTWSTFDRPPRTDLVSLPEHVAAGVLVKNKRLARRVAKLWRQPVEMFRVDIGNGVVLDAWCMKPPDFDAQCKYPLLVYVYGEPAGQTVLDRWGGDQYLWHLMLAQRGYLVMSFDNRGTPSPRGRDWRKAVYRQVGILGPQDQAAAVRAVIDSRPYVDRERIGIWGWSGGGSSSLQAIFKYPELYQTAIAVAPVSNQCYYDTIYQERYMGLPQENVDGFLNGSPINFAHQLQGNLLLIHGTGDDNVHYQATEALANELIRHNKHFTIMPYPNRTHAIGEGENTARHLRQLMARYLQENLPAGPKCARPR